MHTERGQARFQLQERLKRARIAHPNDAIAEEVDLAELADVDDTENEFRFDDEGRVQMEGPEDNAHREARSTKKVRAQFGRKRTHNEQIIVAPCGMILARETFYGAEAVSSVVVSVCLVHLCPSPTFFE